MKISVSLPGGGPEVQVDAECVKPGRLWVHRSLGDELFWIVTCPATGQVIARFDRKGDADKARKILEKSTRPLTLELVLSVLGRADKKGCQSGTVSPSLES